jgi:hypothetical protein
MTVLLGFFDVLQAAISGFPPQVVRSSFYLLEA